MNVCLCMNISAKYWNGHRKMHLTENGFVCLVHILLRDVFLSLVRCMCVCSVL